MKLERIGVDHHQAVASFPFHDLPPPGDVALDPEACLRLGLAWDGRVVGQLLEQGKASAMRSAPGRLPSPAGAFDNDDHVWCAPAGTTRNVMKRCPKCGLVKPVTQFHRNNLRRDGVQSICKVCRAEMDHERYEAKVGRSVKRQPQRSRSGLRGWLTSLKRDRPCTDCGKVFLPQVMQWDHRPGFEKLGELSDFLGSLARRDSG